jgi:hypothetical protein
VDGEKSRNLPEDPVVKLLREGRASSAPEAERLYLEEHLSEVVCLVKSDLSDEDFRRHPLIAALLSHGSRGWDDSPL